MTNETRKNINETIKGELGISYDEFELLDFDEQQRLIAQNRKNKKVKSKNVGVMIGSGEHAIFVNMRHGERYMLDDGTFVMAGDTPEQSKIRLENKLNGVVYSKPVAFVKKLGRRIKNR